VYKMALEVTDATFEQEVLQSDKPVLVDFWAEWCGPCRQLLPKVEALAEEKADVIKIVKVNVDKSPEAPGRYGVRSIPSLFIFKGGEIVAHRTGGAEKSDLEKWISENV